jgi:hypothetical protein
LSIISVPQYRISHRVSAVGIPSGTGSLIATAAYLEAKKWAENRLSTAFYQATPLSGIGNFFNSSAPTVSTFNNLYLYNHLRSTNFSITEGSYEVTDTWLAMQSGISYIEDYNIDASSDDKFVKTVRVQGQIKGLSMVPFSVMSGDPSFSNPNVSGTINMTASTRQMPSSALAHSIPDNSGQTSATANIEPNKYQNALSGWIYDIKPYLYRRASLVMQSPDRNRSYIDTTNPSARPGNPIYCYENLLNPNPTSTTEGHDPRKGTISYSVEYTNKLMLISGVLSENIGISDNGPADVFGESFVIGRRLGPILQSLNAKTAGRKDVSIDVTVVPPSSAAGLLMTNSSCPLYTGGTIYSTIDGLIEGLRPFGARLSSIFGSTVTRDAQAGVVFTTQDNQNWNPTEGRYSRSVSWVYEQCNNTKKYLDH